MSVASGKRRLVKLSVALCMGRMVLKFCLSLDKRDKITIEISKYDVGSRV